MKYRLVICLFTLAVSGCSSIKFVQYDQPGENRVHNRWHHTALNGLVELSEPLDITNVCGDKAWTTITVERTAMNILVGAFSPSVPYLTLYVPWSNKVECYETLPRSGADEL